MAKKKSNNVKQRKALIRTGIISLAVVVCAAAAAVAWYLVDKESKSWVLRFDGQKISAEALRFFALNSSSSEEDPKEGGYTSLTNYLVMDKAAKSLGISPDADALTSAKAAAESFKSSISEAGIRALKLTDDEMAGFFAVGSLYAQLLEHYTNDYVPDEETFETDFADYYENGERYWRDMDLKYVFNTDKEAIDAAYEAITQGAAFDDAVKEHSMDYQEDAGVTTIKLSDLGLSEDMAAKILALSVGERTEVINLTEGAEAETDYEAYAIFEAEAKAEPTEDEVRESFRAQYVNAKKSELFDGIMNQELESCDIQRNDKVYEAFDMWS